MIRFLMPALCLVASVNANAYSYSGNELLSDLTIANRLGVSVGNSLREGLGNGYILGVADTLISIEAVCVPRDVTHKQIKDMTLKFLENNPGKRHGKASTLIYDALVTSFPCKK